MQPVADRVPRRVMSVVYGFVFAAFLFACAKAQVSVPDSEPLTGMRLELKRTDAQQAALLDLLRAQRTPGSDQYRKWLTPEEFADRFAPGKDARQMASDWLQQQGFQVDGVSRNGMRVAFRGTAAQVRRAFAVTLQAEAAGSPSVAVKREAGLRLPVGIAARELLAPAAPRDAVRVLRDAVEANAQAAVLVPAVAGEVAAETWQELLGEAAAEGITVVQVNGGGPESDAASAALLASSVGAAQPAGTGESRPDWQAAAGLPVDGLRAAPDAVLGDAVGLVAALNAAAQQHGRFGALAPQMYRLAVGHGVFTHADGAVPGGAVPDGVWTAADGLGTVNVQALVRALVTGTTGVNVALTAGATTVTHGQSLGLSYAVTGTGGTPTGTVTATLKGRSGGTVTLGPTSLNASGVATFESSTLPGDVYDISGSYSGDSTFAAGASNIVTTTVSPENVVLAATAPATAVGASIPVTVTATSASGVGVPSGAVTVSAYTSAVPTMYTATLPASSTSSASTVVNVPATSVGKLSLLANCTSNGSFACNKPTSFLVAVTQETPLVTLSSVAETLISNSATQKYDLSVTVTSPSGAAVAPTGSVTVANNGVTVGTVALVKGAATYTISLSGTGNSLTAAYAGDTNYAAATSPAVVVNAPLIPTMTSLAASPVSVTFGSGVSLTASVTPGTYAAGGAPTGTVTYKSNLQGTIGTATLGNGYVTYTLANLQVGMHTITATYGGDASYLQSTSSPATVTVAQGKASTTTTLTVSPQAPLAGQMTTFTATVAPSFNVPAGTPTPSVTCTGQVTFFSNNAFVANGTMTAGTATVSGKLPAGNDSLTAVYSGDSQCYGSTSAALSVVTARVGAVVSLQPSTGYANAGQTIQLTATLAGASATTVGVPTGTVMFYDLRGGTQVTLGTATLTATGNGTAVAMINVSGSSAGQHSFSAAYSGDSIFTTATSSQAVVNFGDASLSFNPASLTIAAGGSGSASAAVSGANGFSATVVLSCMAPGGSMISCSFQPSAVSPGDASTLTVTTASQSGKAVRAERSSLLAGGGATLAALLLLPFRRTRSLAAVLLLVCCVALTAGGCGLGTVDATNNLNSGTSNTGAGSGGGTTTTGTPLGTQLLTITAASSDGTLRHTYTYPVTVQ